MRFVYKRENYCNSFGSLIIKCPHRNDNVMIGSVSCTEYCEHFVSISKKALICSKQEPDDDDDSLMELL